jgi:hypothetical protein
MTDYTMQPISFSLVIIDRRRNKMNTKIFSAILVLALASMACGFDIDLPERAEPGPDVEESITVPVSALSGDEASEETSLTISFGAGTLKLSPGAKDLVDGTAVYNFPEFKPEIVKNGCWFNGFGQIRNSCKNFTRGNQPDYRPNSKRCIKQYPYIAL